MGHEAQLAAKKEAAAERRAAYEAQVAAKKKADAERRAAYEAQVAAKKKADAERRAAYEAQVAAKKKADAERKAAYEAKAAATHSLRGRKLAATQHATLTAYGTFGAPASGAAVEAAMKNKGISTLTTLQPGDVSTSSAANDTASFPVVAVGASVGSVVLAAGLIAFVAHSRKSATDSTQNEASEVAQTAGIQML